LHPLLINIDQAAEDLKNFGRKLMGFNGNYSLERMIQTLKYRSDFFNPFVKAEALESLPPLSVSKSGKTSSEQTPPWFSVSKGMGFQREVSSLHYIKSMITFACREPSRLSISVRFCYL